MPVPEWIRELRMIDAQRDIDHDEYMDADEVRDAVRAAWWAGFLWAAAGAAVLAVLALGIR